MKKSIETYIVDSFTDEAFKGNPAGICILDKKIDSTQMLSIAKELGLSETAFIRKIDDHSNKYSIRFFSPKMEIPLCGHATLAASKILFKNKTITQIHFVNIQNLDLIIQKEGQNIIMEFPVYETISQDCPQELLEALGINEIINSEYNEETKILLIEIKDSNILRNLKPNYERLKKSHSTINGVLVTSRSKTPEYDFESRYFWPWSGTDEDPVTGGTHTFLAKYWSLKLGKIKMKSFQCSERTGTMQVELLSDEKMIIKGKAQITLKGSMYL